ncbi:MAG: PD-(D/E)XK nuclease family protein, partial [Candidatus Zipacnadales bacterium]
ARHVLREGRRRPLEGVRLMVVDGFTDFTTTQLQMLQALATKIPLTLITLDYAPDDTREHLAPWFHDTMQRLYDHLGHVVVRTLDTNTEGGPLAHLRAKLFVRGKVECVPPEQCVHIVRCPTPEYEIQEVLARAKTLIVQGIARPSDIAIICRSARERAAALRNAARRMNLPLHIEASTSLADTPVIREIIHVYDTVLRGYCREDVLALLRSSWFSFVALANRGVTYEDIAQLAARALVLEGRAQWRERLEAYAQGPSRRGNPTDVRLRALTPQVVEALEEIFSLLPDPQPKSSIGERVAELRGFLRATNVWQNAARADLPDYASLNIEALEWLESGLDELEHIPRFASRDETSLRAFYDMLMDLLDDIEEAPPRVVGGRVSVFSAHQVRQLRFPVVFVVGLTEQEFPRRPWEEPFFSLQELRKLEEADLLLERRRSPEAREPLLFYLAISAAERELWLTYPATDADGKSLQPSHYLDEITQLLEPGKQLIENIPLSEVVPPLERLTSFYDLATRAYFDLAHGQGEETQVAYNALLALPKAQDQVRRIARGLALDNDRNAPEPTGKYVGILDDPAILTDLATRYGAECPFSARELTTYARCPFDFLCRFVLRLQAPEQPTAIPDRRLVGSVRHAILAQFTRACLETRPDRPLIEPGEEAEALAELDALIDHEFAAAVRRCEIADEAVWAAERERCRRDMALWVELEAREFGNQWPLAVECHFGHASSPVPLPNRPDILIDGFIDRINAAPVGGPVSEYTLVDYKLGDLPSNPDIIRGAVLQFPLYALGAEASFPELVQASAVGWLYVRLGPPLKVAGLRRAEQIAAARPDLEATIAAYVDNIRRGYFSYLDVEKCPSYCASREVCRFEA